MDWVQNKTSGKKNQSRRQSTDPSTSSTSAQSSTTSNPSKTASGWLEELCHENIALLQSSLPVTKTSKAGRKKASVERPIVDALNWGVAAIQIEDKVDLTYLGALIDTLQAEEGAPSTTDLTPAKIAKWIGKQLPLRSEEPAIALLAAGWIHGLPNLGRHIEPGLWLETLQIILTQVDRAWVNSEPESMLAWLIWSCEVPLALASQLSQLGCNDRFVSDTLDRLALVLELTKEKSSPWLKNGGSSLRALLACVVRCRWTADQLGARRWYACQRKAVVDLASKAIAFSDNAGKPLLVDEEIGETDAELWAAIFEVTDQNAKLGDLMSSLPKGVRPAKLKRSLSKASLAPLGFYDSDAEVSLMRREWKSNGCRVAVDFANDPMWLDVLDGRGERVLSGWWEIQVSKNGKPLDVDCGWTEVCWFSDDDVDYLEMQCEVDGKCILQRQIMLAREEGLVFAADALLGAESADWELESRFPLASAVQFNQEVRSREGFLSSESDETHKMALVMPIALPEWRKTNATGELTHESDSLVLTQRAQAQRLYSPIAFALRKRHQSASYTWRQLTVAQDLSILTRDVAAAYRIQIGKEQWVLYRSLTQSTRRTMMGLHLNSEFYAGRFDSEDGQYEALVEVDAEAE